MTSVNLVEAARYMATDAEPWLAPAVFAFNVREDAFAPEPHVGDGGELVLPSDTNPVEAGNWLIHVVWHMLRDHPARLASLPDRTAAGLAGCVEIGEPPPESLGLPGELLAEEYYQLLCGHAQPDDNTGCGIDLDNLAPATPADENQWEALRAATAVEALARGDTLAGLRRWAEGVVTPPKIPWSTVLAAWVGDAANIAGMDDWGLRRPNRRHDYDSLVVPSLEGTTPRVGVVVDTSGSITDQDLMDALSEISGILLAEASELVVVSCDTESTDPITITDVTDLTHMALEGGGGSDMTAGLARLATVSEFSGARLSGAVIVTDGDVGWPAVNPLPIPVVAVLLAGNREHPSWLTGIVR